MSEPAWHAECRKLFAKGKTKRELGEYFCRTLPTIQRALNGTRTQYEPKRGHNPRLSEAMKKRWADPVWANRQRLRVSQGLLNSTRQIGRPPKEQRWDVQREERPVFNPATDPKPEWLKRART